MVRYHYGAMQFFSPVNEAKRIGPYTHNTMKVDIVAILELCSWDDTLLLAC